MAAQLVGGLGSDMPPIPLEFVGKHPVKQIGRQPDPADQLQLGQRILNAGEARLARIAAQPQKQCRHQSPRLCRGRVLEFVPGRAQQRLQPLSYRRDKAVENAGTEPLIMSTDRSANDAVDTIGCGRLDRKRAAPRLQKRNELIRNRTDSRHLISQPIFEQRRIGDARLSKASQGADFGTMPFGGPPRQARRKARGSRDSELLCDLRDEQRLDLAGSSRKPPLVAEERQQNRKTQPVAVVLGHDERQIRKRQRRSLQGRSFVDSFQFWASRIPR